MFVLDASRTLAICLEDEHGDAGVAELIERLKAEAAIAPAIWALEVANGLRTAVRRGRITAGELPRIRSLVERLPVVLVEVDTRAATGEVLDLALAHDLTTYDTAYLDLAMRRGIALATADERLQKACREAGVTLIA